MVPTYAFTLLVLIATLTSSYALPHHGPKQRKRDCRARDNNDPRTHHQWAGHYTRSSGGVGGNTLSFDAPSAVLSATLNTGVATNVAVQAPTGLAAFEVTVKTTVTIPTTTKAAPIPIITTSVGPVVPAAAKTTAVAPPAPVKSDTLSTTSNSGASPVGLSVDYLSHCNGASFGPKISWYYSWTLDTWPGMEGIEFVPMVKNRQFVEAFQPAQLRQAKYVLSLNEPDNAGQNGGAAIPESQAAALHKSWTSKAPQGIEIGSIAVTNGGWDYWNKWKAACAGSCRYDFIPIHFYGTNAADFITYAKNYANEGKPVWVTEIACRIYVKDGKIDICSLEDSKKMMKESIGWMRGEGAAFIHRWTWFGAWAPGVHAEDQEGNHPGFNLIDASGNANELGKYFASL